MLAAFFWGLLPHPAARGLGPAGGAPSRALRRDPGPHPGHALRCGGRAGAVLRLFATGDFEDVAVQVSSGEARGGARLSNPRVRRDSTARRCAATAALSAERLVRAARLRLGEPLWPKRLRAAAVEAERDLQADGWLDARVEAKAEPRAEGALLVFDVSRGPRVFLRFARVDAVPPPARPRGPRAPRARRGVSAGEGPGGGRAHAGAPGQGGLLAGGGRAGGDAGSRLRPARSRVPRAHRSCHERGGARLRPPAGPARRGGRASSATAGRARTLSRGGRSASRSTCTAKGIGTPMVRYRTEGGRRPRAHRLRRHAGRTRPRWWRWRRRAPPSS